MSRVTSYFKYQKFFLLSIGTLIYVSVCISSCSKIPAPHKLTGYIFGTQYNISVVGEAKSKELQDLHLKIKQALGLINQQMSSWEASSVLNKINSYPLHKWLVLPPDLFKVISSAKKISEQTHGMFDITLAPVIKLWGFKSYTTQTSIPPKGDIQLALATTGVNKLHLNAPKMAILKSAAVTIDLAAIAKGYAVDKISSLISQGGFANHLVEIGGEVMAVGRRSDKKKWLIAIETPTANKSSIQRILSVSNMAVATSGDYRNFFKVGSTSYSHTINPFTGYPITHNLASVTVISVSTMHADAMATALLVMGTKKALAFAHKNKISALFITRTTTGFKEEYSPNFKQYLHSN